MRPSPKITPKMVVAIVEQARIEAAEEAALRISAPLAAAVLLAGLIGIGWMVRTSWAQEKEPATPAAPAPLQLPAKETVAEKPVPDEPAPGPVVPLPSLPASPGSLPPEAAVAEARVEPVAIPVAPIAGESDDPEKTVQAFVDQNRKTAEGQLKSLKSEAERLRARLQKVEAGIRRRESLMAALEKSEAAAKDVPPTNLEEIPSARPQFKPKPDASTRNGPPVQPELADPPPPVDNTPGPPKTPR